MTLNEMRTKRIGLADERGVALISVIGAAAILAVFTAVIVARSIGNFAQVRRERVYEQTLHIAEAGIDHTLFELSENEDYDTGDTLPGSFADEAAEKEWVLATAALKTTVQAPDGEWVAIKPQSVNVIYAVGYVPSRASPTRIRVIKAQYDFPAFSPEAAVLAGGDLTISGDPEIDGTAGSMHANGDVYVSGNPELSGSLSASENYSVSGSVQVGDPDNTGGGKPKADIPDVVPRDFYPMSEYDLCPDGTVRTGPSYTGPGPQVANTSGVPCGGDFLANAASNSYRGWKRSGTDSSQGAKWDSDGDTAYDGVYYVYQGSVVVGSNPGTPASPWAATIIAEASGSDCSLVGGDVEISGNPDFRYSDVGQPLFVVAGRDLKIGGNPVGTGIMMAHEQFGISGNPELVGAVLSEQACNTPGSPISDPSFISGNPQITYDDNYEIPLASGIRTTHWVEL